jgi:hypothetical protein
LWDNVELDTIDGTREGDTSHKQDDQNQVGERGCHIHNLKNKEYEKITFISNQYKFPYVINNFGQRLCNETYLKTVQTAITATLTD